jgi:hypothetical protein
MPDSCAVTGLRQLAPEQLRAAVADLLPKSGTRAERVGAIETALTSLAGQSLRGAMAEWIVDGIVPVRRLVPEAYEKWRPPVRDAMMFVVARLLRLIAKVPGLQKLGQVIARNQNLRPALRNALARLENGIRDVKPEDIRSIIEQDLGPRLKTLAVKVEPAILSEGSAGIFRTR